MAMPLKVAFYSSKAWADVIKLSQPFSLSIFATRISQVCLTQDSGITPRSYNTPTHCRRKARRINLSVVLSLFPSHFYLHSTFLLESLPVFFPYLYLSDSKIEPAPSRYNGVVSSLFPNTYFDAKSTLIKVINARSPHSLVSPSNPR